MLVATAQGTRDDARIKPVLLHPPLRFVDVQVENAPALGQTGGSASNMSQARTLYYTLVVESSTQCTQHRLGNDLLDVVRVVAVNLELSKRYGQLACNRHIEVSVVRQACNATTRPDTP